jgi:hypothetical protein
LEFPIYDPILYEYVNIEIPLSNLESYAKDIEEFLDDKFIESVRKHEENEDDEFHEDEDYDEDDSFIRSIRSYSFFQEDSYRYAIEFPNIMRTSLFYSCFAFLENYLLFVCKNVKSKKNLGLDISDIKHNGIEKAQVYLKKVVGLNFPDQSVEWNHIRKCNKIRNILIHNGGLIDSNNEKLLKDIESIKGVKIERTIPTMNGKIMLKESFCFDFIKSMRIFLREISKEI